MSQVTVRPSAALSSASGAGSPADRLTLIAQSPSGATPPAKQRLQALPNGDGEVAVRDEAGNTLATTLKARQVWRNGQWRSEGFVAERMSAYSASAPHGNAQPEPNGYGYFRAEHGKMRVITGRDGRVITDLAQARARTSELIRHGGLSMTTDAQAQTAKDVMLRKPSTPMVTSTQLTQWKPVIPLPKPIEKMSPVDRAKYMVKEALRVAPVSVRKELQSLLKPENLALMAGFAAAQAVPGVNVVVDVVAGLMLGKEVIESGSKIISAIRSGLSTQQPYELVKAGDQLAEAFSHLGVGVGIALIGGVAARGAGKLRTKAAPVEGLSLPQPKQLQGANNIVPFARPLRSKASGRPGGSGGAQGLGRPAGGAVATASAPARAGTALATAQSNGIRQQGNHASHTPVPAVLPLPKVRAAAVLPLPTVQPRPEDKPLPEKRRGAGDGSSRVEPGMTRTPAEETKLKAWLSRQGDPLREQQINAYREGRITDKEDVLGGRTNADRKDMSAALDKIDRTRIGPSRGGGAGRSHTTAEVKEIWRLVDRTGGVQALPEATLRRVIGITQQALKNTDLTSAERADFTKRLNEARTTQGQHHRGRETVKVSPAGQSQRSELRPVQVGHAAGEAAAGAGNTAETRGEWAAAERVLADTDLLRNGALTPAAMKLIGTAQQRLARETGVHANSIPRETGALQVAVDHWTARIDREPAAFDKARAAQTALTQAMGPLRLQAEAQSAVGRLDADYKAAIASVRKLEPKFDEAMIGATRVGDVTLSELEPSMTAHDFASFKLDIANRYLAQYQVRRAGASDSTSAPAPTSEFLNRLPPATRKRWDSQLIGGPTLNEVVASVAQGGGGLTIESVDQAVRRAQPALRPPTFPYLDPHSVVADARFYEIRYDTASDFSKKLGAALASRVDLPIQIRTADGSRRLDVYRHGTEQNGSTIIDQRDGSALAQPNGLRAAIAGALGIEGDDHGALVVSYGSSATVMADKVRPYRSADEVLRMGIADPASRQESPLPRSPAQKLSKLQGDYASFLRSLDVRRSQGLPFDRLGSNRLMDIAKKLADASPGLIGEQSARIKVSLDTLELIDYDLRTLSSIGENSLTVESGLAKIRENIGRHGFPASYSGPRDEVQLLQRAITTWARCAMNIFQEKPTGFHELDGLPQARRLEIDPSPGKLLEWFFGSRNDWNQWFESM